MLGSGSGFPVAHARMLRQGTGAQVTVVDASDTNLAYAQRQARAVGIADDRLRFIWADPDALLRDLPDTDPNVGRFDAVECSGLLRHTAAPDALLQGVSRLLRPGGVAVLQLPSLAAEAELGSVRQFVQDLSAGLPKPFIGADGEFLRMPSVPEVRIARRALLAASSATPARQAALQRKVCVAKHPPSLRFCVDSVDCV